jgi:hypothetical protein
MALNSLIFLGSKLTAGSLLPNYRGYDAKYPPTLKTGGGALECSRAVHGNDGHRHRNEGLRHGRNGHRWASTSISMSAISDIDICYSDIGDKNVGLKNVIPISEVFRYRHQSSFRYPILKKKNVLSCIFEPTSLGMISECCNTKLLYLSKAPRR